MRYHNPMSTGWTPPEVAGGGWSPMGTRGYDNHDNQVVILGVNEVNAATSCNCFTGTPYVDASGNCTCVETDTVPTKPIYLDGSNNSRFQPKPLQTVTPEKPQPQPQTIIDTLKANPVLVGVAILAGILLIKK